MRKTMVLILVIAMIGGCFGAMANELALQPYDETVVMDVMREFNSFTWYPEGEDIANNVLLDYMRDTLNIDIEVSKVIDEGYGSTQLDLAIAANDLPDVFQVSPAQLYRLVMAGQIQPIGEAYEKYASDNVKSVLGDVDGPYFSQSKVDGNVYGFPYTNDYHERVGNAWLRKDWLDKVGMDVPVTWEDFEAVMDAFMNMPVNADGSSASYGIGFIPNIENSGYVYQWNGMLNCFDVHYDFWEKDEQGKLVYSMVTDKARGAIEKLAELYNKGYLNPEFAMQTNGQLAADVAAGKVGMMIGNFYPYDVIAASCAADPEASWMVTAMPPCADGEYKASGNSKSTAYIVVREGYEHPEAIVKYMNLWYEMWRGEKGEYYHGLNQTDYIKADENFKYYLPFWFDPPLKNFGHANLALTIFPDGDDSVIGGDYELRKQYDHMLNWYNGDAGDIGGLLHYWGYVSLARVDGDVYGSPDRLVEDAYGGPLTEDFANYSSVVTPIMTQYYVSAIMGAKNIDSDWDEFVKSWYASGGQIMTDEANAWLANS